MDREKQIGRRLEQMQLLLKQQRIGAKRDEPLLRNQALDDLGHFLVDQGLAAGDGDHGRAAFLGRVQAFLHGHPAIEDRLGIIDLAATRARQIAAEQRLQHQNQGIALAAHKLLFEKICTDPPFLKKRQDHVSTPLLELSFCLRGVSRHQGGLKQVAVKVKWSEARQEAGIRRFPEHRVNLSLQWAPRFASFRSHLAPWPRARMRPR